MSLSPLRIAPGLASKPVPNSQSLTCAFSPIRPLEQMIEFSILALNFTQSMTIFAIFIGYNLLFLNCYEIPDHTVIQLGPLANHTMPSNDTFLDTRLFSDPRALPKHTIR